MSNWKAFLIELVLYTGLLLVYFIIVLHFLGGWFKELYDHDRDLFAVMALVIMIGQTVGLEIVSSFLIWLMRRKKTNSKRSRS